MSVILTSGPVRVEVDLNRGGDITSYIDERAGGEILWISKKTEAPDGAFSELSHNTQGFYDAYQGGIQELFPNTADATAVLGAELPFHGELCRTPMALVEQSSASITITADLRRYPVRVNRTISLDDTGRLTIRSEVVNLSSRELPYSWGLHPVFSEILTGENSHLWCKVKRAFSHPKPFANHQLYPPGSEVVFEERDGFGNFLPLSPPDSGTADLVYIELEENWFQLGRLEEPSIRVSWTNADFRFLWLWQECHGQDDWPWWGQHHVVGVEPHTAAPATGLAEHIAERRELRLLPFASRDAEFVFEVLEDHTMKGSS